MALDEPWCSSVGIAQQDNGPVLIVYLRSRAQNDESGIPTIWEGIPVQMKRTGRIQPATRRIPPMPAEPSQRMPDREAVITSGPETTDSGQILEQDRT